jgi:hypothetical protein
MESWLLLPDHWPIVTTKSVPRHHQLSSLRQHQGLWEPLVCNAIGYIPKILNKLHYAAIEEVTLEHIRDQSQGLAHARQVLYFWATPSGLVFCLDDLFWWFYSHYGCTSHPWYTMISLCFLHYICCYLYKDWLSLFFYLENYKYPIKKS